MAGIVKNFGEEGLKQAGKSIESTGTIIAEGLDHSLALKSVGLNISKSVLVGFGVLAVGGILTSTLNGLNSLQMSHESHKYGKELKEVDRNVSLSDSIAQEKEQISFFWNSFVITSVAGGAAVVGFISIACLRLID